MRAQNSENRKRKCDFCGKEYYFDPYAIKMGRGKYCSQKCASMARLVGSSKRPTDSPIKITKICLNCGKEFDIYSNIIKNYCSNKCRDEHKITDIYRQCIVCKKQFYTPSNKLTDICCSKDCSSILSKRNVSFENDLSENQLIAFENLLQERDNIRGGLWYGGVFYIKNKQKYCELWPDVNERVHAFFDYKCVGCGTPEINRSHAGHHVFYVKNACCWFDKEGIYYTNLNAPNHIGNDYCIGDNPNYFVILCPKCHGETNGNFGNRKRWADYYKNLIDKEYGGKSYYTKEEWEIIKKENIGVEENYIYD
jgi:hypothetical protein